MARARETVLVQPEAPKAVPVDHEWTREAWASYSGEVWEARLMAHLHARYFSSMRRWLGWLSGTLQMIVVLGSTTAFVSVLREFGGPHLTSVLTATVAVAAAIVGLTSLPARVQKAATLEEAWGVRCSFWNEALIMVQNGQWLGPLPTLQAPEAALRKVEAEIGIPQISWYIAHIQREVMTVDRFARSQTA